MKQNEFYEVDGCMDFIPVTINETYADAVGVTANESIYPCKLSVKHVYRFPKVCEPQKVVVPKFVAEWIEECKRSGWHLQKALYRLDDDEKVGDWAYDENDDLIAEKVDVFARAWLAYPNITIEQEKVVVPKFVVDWIEDHKGYVGKWDEEARADFVFMAINDLFRLGEGLKPLDFTIDEKVSEWMTENTYKFITAILFDYTVKKEKLYTVEIPNPNLNAHTVLQKTEKGIVLISVANARWRGWESSKLTEAEIKQDFEWAWQWAVPVEDKVNAEPLIESYKYAIELLMKEEVE